MILRPFANAIQVATQIIFGAPRAGRCGSHGPICEPGRACSSTMRRHPQSGSHLQLVALLLSAAGRLCSARWLRHRLVDRSGGHRRNPAPCRVDTRLRPALVGSFSPAPGDVAWANPIGQCLPQTGRLCRSTSRPADQSKSADCGSLVLSPHDNMANDEAGKQRSRPGAHWSRRPRSHPKSRYLSPTSADVDDVEDVEDVEDVSTASGRQCRCGPALAYS